MPYLFDCRLKLLKRDYRNDHSCVERVILNMLVLALLVVRVWNTNLNTGLMFIPLVASDCIVHAGKDPVSPTIKYLLSYLKA